MSSVGGGVAINVGYNKSIKAMGKLLVPTAALKSDVGSLVTSSSGAFWSRIEKQGAYITSSLSTNYQTIVDIEGSGVLTHVIAGALSETGDIYIKITLDGEVHEIVASSAPAGFHAVLFCGETDPRYAVTYGYSTSFVYNFLILNNNEFIINTVPFTVSKGYGVGFDNNLKVEVKRVGGSTSSGATVYSGVMYDLL